MFGINGGELLILLVVVVVVVGPERLPRYAEVLGAWVRTLRGLLRTAKTRVDAELGEQGADVDWSSLDPRRYDPRRIVREALLDDLPAPAPRQRPAEPTTPDAGAGAGEPPTGAVAA